MNWWWLIVEPWRTMTTSTRSAGVSSARVICFSLPPQIIYGRFGHLSVYLLITQTVAPVPQVQQQKWRRVGAIFWPINRCPWNLIITKLPELFMGSLCYTDSLPDTLSPSPLNWFNRITFCAMHVPCHALGRYIWATAARITAAGINLWIRFPRYCEIRGGRVQDDHSNLAKGWSITRHCSGILRDANEWQLQSHGKYHKYLHLYPSLLVCSFVNFKLWLLN